MSYIYDILLNFNENLYDFYEWNLNDDIVHIRKMPIIKVSTTQMIDIIQKKIKFTNDFLNKVKNKTELFTNKAVKLLNYSLIISDNNKALGILLNDSGELIKYSSLLIDEELDVIEMAYNLEETKLEFEIINTFNAKEFKTRKEEAMQKFILKELDVIKKTADMDKLKYLCFECFDEKIETRDELITKIETNLKNNWNEVYLKVYNFLKLTSIKR